MVYALPDDLADWVRLSDRGNVVTRPEVHAFWLRVGLTAYESAIAVWPDRERLLAWLLDPYGSPFGPGDDRSPYATSRPYLRSAVGGHDEAT